MGSIVIGIDPSSKKLAVVWSVDDGPLHGFTHSSKQADLNDRCAEFYRITRSFYRGVSMQHQDHEIHVFLEAPVLGRGGARSTIVQAKVNGAIVAGCLVAGAVKVHDVNNQSWKKKVVGKGNAGKPDIKKWVAQYWRQLYVIANNGKDQDLIDAGCIMRYGQDIVGVLERLRRHRAAEAQQRRPRKRLIPKNNTRRALHR